MNAELKQAARTLAAARTRLEDAKKQARRAAIGALAEGATEKDVAVALGVNRLTIRDWQGKSRKASATEPG